MSKTIKVIDLLNKIANGEEVPENIDYHGNTYIYNKERKKYFEKNTTWLYVAFNTNELNDIVEIIEEQEEIDIQNIEELEKIEDYEADPTDVKLNRQIINKLVQAVKQLDKKIKEK